MELVDITDYTAVIILMFLSCYTALKYGWKVVSPFYFWEKSNYLEKVLFLLAIALLIIGGILT